MLDTIVVIASAPESSSKSFTRTVTSEESYLAIPLPQSA
jgi:hypothetical protein